MATRPAKQSKAPAREPSPVVMAEVGLTGLRHDKHSVQEEYLPRLAGTAGVKKFREMRDTSWAVGAFSWAVETLIRQAPWKTVRPDDRPESRELEEHVESCRHDMEQTWQETLSEVLSFVYFGWSAAEKVYKVRRGRTASSLALRSKYSDGRVGWLALAPRAQESLSSWRWDDTGRVTHLVQSAWPMFRTVEIPIEKILLFRPRSAKNNPEGRSLMRNAVRSWDFEKRLEEIEAIGISRDLAGILMARVPPELMSTDATPEQAALREHIQAMVRKVDRNEYEGLVYAAKEIGQEKTGFDLELLTSGGGRQIDTNEIVKRYESRILISLLAEFLMLGMEAHGSFALADSKTNVFAMSLGALLGAICDVLNGDAVPELASLNGYDDPTTYPQIQHGDIETPDLSAMANFVSSLKNAGLLAHGPKLERFLCEYGGLPLPEIGAADPKPAPAPEPDPAPEPAPAEPPRLREAA